MVIFPLWNIAQKSKSTSGSTGWFAFINISILNYNFRSIVTVPDTKASHCRVSRNREIIERDFWKSQTADPLLKAVLTQVRPGSSASFLMKF